MATRLQHHLLRAWRPQSIPVLLSGEENTASFHVKVRNQNGLTREEFNELPAQELVKLINDPVLAKFALETKDYDLASKVAIIKRIKTWGRS